MAQKYGALANVEQFDREKPCAVCDDPHPTFSWTDYHGEGYCLKCGTAYQLKAGELTEGETYPRLNIAEKHLPMLRRYFQETGRGNASGTFLGIFLGFGEYPDQGRDRVAFNKWVEQHRCEYPELNKKEAVEPQPQEAP